MKIIDTHCHPYLNNKKDLDNILKNFFENSGEAMIVIGTDLKNSKKALEIANKNDNIFCTIGIHPCDIENLDLKETISILEKMYLDNKEKVIAIGEIGLDYYWLEKDADKFFEKGIIKNKEEYKIEIKNSQKSFFNAQINLAKKLGIPIVIHNRDAKEDIFNILVENNFKNFVFHCYSEDLVFAKKILEFSSECKISFSGIVTFKNAENIQNTAKNIPLENILAETDSPYLTPIPYRGKEENEPIFTKFVIEKISEIRKENLEKVSDKIFENSKKFFNLKI